MFILSTYIKILVIKDLFINTLFDKSLNKRKYPDSKDWHKKTVIANANMNNELRDGFSLSASDSN